MPPELQALLRVTLPSSRGPRELDLRMPPINAVTYSFHDEDVVMDEHNVARWLPSLSLTFIRTVDGARVRWDNVEDVAADSVLMRAFLTHLKAMIDRLRERGRVFALCPGCKTAEIEVPFVAYALMIASPVKAAGS